MTNILASIAVCIVTNVTTVDNAVYGCSMCMPVSPGILLMHDCGHDVLHSEATAKTDTITVMEITQLEFTFKGKAWVLRQSKELSRKERKFVKKETLEESK